MNNPETKIMKDKKQIIVSAFAALFLACSAPAQEIPDPKPAGAEYARHAASPLRGDRLNNVIKAGDAIGMTVKNYGNEKLGSVERIYLDVESGRIAQVILTSGGFLSVGGTLTAVPPGAMQPDPANKIFFLDSSREKFATAPEFDPSAWKAGNQFNRLTETYADYSEDPYFVAGGDRFRNSSPEKNRTVEFPRIPNETDPARDGDADHLGTSSPASELGYIDRAKRLQGTAVKDLQGRKLGRVENFMVDVSAGRIVVVIISSGGFMGLGYGLNAVPPSALHYNAAHDTLQLDASRQMLASSPHFRPNEWPDFRQPDYVGKVYRAYGVTPYFDTEVAVDADHTERDMHDPVAKILTPLDQGNRRADLKTTTRIRKAILADGRMSPHARIVKIVTLDGWVTLTGPVNTTEEKQRIGEITNRIARADNVDNQLEVQLITSNND